MNSRLLIASLILIGLTMCRKEQAVQQTDRVASPPIRSVDISSFPKIREAGTDFYDADGKQTDMLLILKDAGVNTIRLRLWVNPDSMYSSFQEVAKFSDELQQVGFDIWLSLHYSDTWADPGQQSKPQKWNGLSFDDLLDTVYHYTYKVAYHIQPAIIQIGNEINSGFLHPEGNRTNKQQFHLLLQQGIRAVRSASPGSLIMMHYAGHVNSEYFLEELDTLDFDLLGLSYYPIWHGQVLDSLRNKLRLLATLGDRRILIAETAYPFTLGYNDHTNNIVGLPSQLIPGYAASPQGQKKYIAKIRQICSDLKAVDGFCYWGAELLSWKGPQSTEGSPWENQALFDFDERALPALDVFD